MAQARRLLALSPEITPIGTTVVLRAPGEPAMVTTRETVEAAKVMGE